MGAVVALLLVATGCQAGVWMGDSDARSVSVIGDSLIYQAEGNYNTEVPTRVLADELVSAGHRAHVSGYVGETVAAGHEQLWPMVASEPGLDTLVIALGTNDVNNDIELESSRAALRMWLIDAAGVRCVALIGLNESAYAWGLDVKGPAFNQMLREEASLHPNGIFVAWEPDLEIHGTSGDVHFPTSESQAQYRAVVHEAVDRCAMPQE